MNDPAFGDDMGLPWWFKLALVVMGLFLLFMVVMVIRAVRLTKHTKAYVAARGWTDRSRDRQLARRWTGPPFESRQPTWDLACRLQGEMFAETARIGGLDVQLVYFRGLGECKASKWASRCGRASAI